MSNFARFAWVARLCGGFVLNFFHGGIVMAGAMVIALIGYQVSYHGLSGLDPVRLFQFSSAQPAKNDDVITPDLALSADGKLSAEMTRVVQYLSRRFKVSSSVVEPLLLTAIREGAANKVDPLLIMAVTSVESSFNPLAESVLGAQGLMQIIPRFHLDKISSEKGELALFDPAENIRVGTRILRDYVRAQGSLEMGLQQYGGALSDATMTYSNKVVTERDRLHHVMQFGSPKAVARETQAPAKAKPDTADLDQPS